MPAGKLRACRRTQLMNIMLMRCFAAIAVAVAPVIVPADAGAKGFVDYGRAASFLTVEVKGSFGGAMVTENYMGSFSEISQMNTAPGTNWCVGVAGVFGLRDWLGLGTEINFQRRSYRVDMAVEGADGASVSNIFLRNTPVYVSVPVYMQFRFNVARNVRWRVDAGLYYAYGIGGKQRQDIYNAQVNSLGQLVSTNISTQPGYFSKDTFIHSFRRSDIGLHLATSMAFRRVAVGCYMDLGFKNLAYIPAGRGIVTPNVHNFTYGVTVSYRL